MATNKKELFSGKVPAGKRTYFFDIKESGDGIRYLVISESKLVGNQSFQHSRVMVFEQHIPSFHEQLKKAIAYLTEDRRKAYSVAEIRRKYPRAYAKWTEEEDARLRHRKNQQILELVTLFQRKPGSIHSRLRKLGLKKK